MKKTLFLVSRAPQKEDLKLIADTAAEGDNILFIEDGVYFCEKLPDPQTRRLEELGGRNVSLHFLSPDLTARGLATEHNKVDYSGFVELIEKNDNVFH